MLLCTTHLLMIHLNMYSKSSYVTQVWTLLTSSFKLGYSSHFKVKSKQLQIIPDYANQDTLSAVKVITR